eukprot:CAMPEP_0172361620 /NCGR_PEP_ID=MMETSP1060-20121228/5430_1 /TAXON_ID=37318 /ORGANISM="Pseudo-nitzschia pungens, Strain cf. cingulata" /LENGTH=568 /DNA_ID=CAMNT_0013083943 /DNA_START=263 /DNA_END=1969 /DNA_ORIENTATION=+
MMILVVSSAVLCAWTTTLEGVSAFCPSPPQSAVFPKTHIGNRIIATSERSGDSRSCRIPSLLRVSTTPVNESTDPATNGSVNSPSATRSAASTREPAGKDDYEDEIAGVVGNWENLYGNWVLRPTFAASSSSSSTSTTSNTNNTSDNTSDNDEYVDAFNAQPRAVVHFLGGALVGKAPHITYRYLLEKLAAEGFLIVATPYNLSFDHLATCDDVLTKFEAVAPTLAKQYGALPVVGIGHSCGALLQVLISSLFPDTPRAANALLSFNNKPVSDAVPFFEEFFAPFFSSLVVGPELGAESGGGSGGSSSSTSTTTNRGPSSNDSLVLGLKLAKAASKGQLPSDELLEEAQRLLGSGFLAAAAQSPIPFPPFFNNNNNNNNKNEQGINESGGKKAAFKIPTEVRETYAKWAEPSVKALSDAGVLPIIHETIVSLEQIPRLIDEVSVVADGARDFNPTPALVRSAAGKAYRPRRTLIVGYQDDPIDESDEIEEVLKEARSITRMKRPMVEIDVQRKVLGGGHAAPLLAPPLDVAERAEDLLGLDTSKERLGYTEAAATVEDLVRWLEEGNL